MEQTKTLYTLIKSEQTIEGQSFETYGIAGTTVNFPDVSTDISVVEEMINRINTYGLEETHLQYFIEDELNRSLI